MAINFTCKYKSRLTKQPTSQQSNPSPIAHWLSDSKHQYRQTSNTQSFIGLDLMLIFLAVLSLYFIFSEAKQLRRSQTHHRRSEFLTISTQNKINWMEWCLLTHKDECKTTVLAAVCVTWHECFDDLLMIYWGWRWGHSLLQKRLIGYSGEWIKRRNISL